MSDDQESWIRFYVSAYCKKYRVPIDQLHLVSSVDVDVKKVIDKMVYENEDL